MVSSIQQQDSSDPTGVRELSQRPPGSGPQPATVKARTRKANAAVQLALSGAEWDEIAEALGYPTPRAARLATEKALEKALKEDPDSRDRMRQMDGRRLERLLRSVWTKAINPDHPEQMVAVDRARLIIDRHAKLYGLDAPQEYIIHAPTQAELEAWVARVVTANTPDVEQYDVIAGEVVKEPHDALPTR